MRCAVAMTASGLVRVSVGFCNYSFVGTIPFHCNGHGGGLQTMLAVQRAVVSVGVGRDVKANVEIAT